MIDQRAFEEDDEEEGATQIAIPAATDDDDFPDMPLVAPPTMTARPSLSAAAAVPQNSPNRISYGSQALMNPMTHNPHAVEEEEKRQKKMLLILIIALVTTFCVIIILVVSILNIKSSDSKPEIVTEQVDTDNADRADKNRPTASDDDDDDDDDDDQKDSAAKKNTRTDTASDKPKAPQLSEFEIANFVDNVVHAGQDEIYISAAYGIYYGSGEPSSATDNKQDDSKDTEKPAEPTTVAKNATTKTTTSKSTNSGGKKSGSSGSSIKKKLAEADKLFSSGKTAKACAIYRSIVSNKDLSKEDKLAVQSKIRRCGRVVL